VSVSTTAAETAAAIVRAKRVLSTDGDARACLCCGRELPLASVIVQKGAAIGRTEDQRFPRVLGGVCEECQETTSEARRADVLELATAARRVDALLELIRHRADRHLMPWWGSVGACTADDVDRASVELRRVLERLGAR
jgi:hypothetical protein